MQLNDIKSFLEFKLKQNRLSTKDGEIIVDKSSRDIIVDLDEAVSPIYIGCLGDCNSIGLFLTAGKPPIFCFDKHTLLREGLQVIVRNSSYEKGYEEIIKIYDWLNTLVGFTPSQSPFFIGRNEKNYAEFSVNYIVLIETERMI